MRATGGGDTPATKKTNWTIDFSKNIAWLMVFVKKYLILTEYTKLFFYVNDFFVPHPDQKIGDLHKSFAKNLEKLMLLLPLLAKNETFLGLVYLRLKIYVKLWQYLHSIIKLSLRRDRKKSF
ncbi:hypothetical protein L596_010206 [Steinernema carpocapsae]|uniref:Ubiquitin-like protein ATG12 n=1 Tax=Steinernema carpocapsae TaxID=34508 RepID=A0A4U5PIY6_STECR|nr:hypothetical protein L596_010206 [Steinernema carpocapsae]